MAEAWVKRGKETNSKHWFTTSYLHWRKVPESDARSVGKNKRAGVGHKESFVGRHEKHALMHDNMLSVETHVVAEVELKTWRDGSVCVCNQSC